MEVKANGGSPGVDGITIDEIEKEVQEFLAGIEAELKSGKYRPKPVLRINIPKPDGTTRPLGIPTLKRPGRPASGKDCYRAYLRGGLPR